MEDKEKARQIFFDSSCHHFFIYDAGKGDEYVLSFARQQLETTKHNIGCWKFLLADNA